jgi:peptide/nickel transport system substrate-binding protein
MKNRSRWWAIAAAAVVLAGCGTAPKEVPAQQPSQPAQEAPAPQPPQPELKKLSLVLDGRKEREAELQAIAGYFRQIGIDAQVRVWEPATLVDEAKKGTRDAYAQDWGSATFSPFDLAVPKLKTQDRGNYSHYSNADVDRLFAEATSTLDERKMNDAYQKVQETLYDEAPWIFGYYRDEIEAASARVRNWQPSVDSRINLHKVSLEGADTLVVGLRSDRILSLDPANYRDRETETVIRNMFDGLVTRTHDGRVVPELAVSWETPNDTTFIFRLRQGVRFHNGDPMTADDVVFTFNRILAPDGVDGKPSPRQGLVAPLQKIEKVDEYTVRMTLANPGPAFLQLLVHTQIIPKRYYEQVGFAGFNEKPVGAGPFRFVSAKLDSEIVMERFDEYWGGPVAVRRAVFRNVPEPATRIAALRSGELHIIQAVPVDSVASLGSDSNLQVKSVQGTRLYMIELNNQRITDKRVRQALNYAVNWDEILKELYMGTAHRVSTALLPSGVGYHSTLKPYPYDPNKAKELLRAAGYATN